MNQWKAPKEYNQIKNDEVHVWATDLSIYDSRIKQLYAILSPDEQQRSNRFKHKKHRDNFITAHGFLRNTLSTYLYQAAPTLKFSKENNGKPILDDIPSNKQLHFNMSHSHTLALLAVCRNKSVGIDVECINKENQWQKIINRFFTKDEQTAIFTLPESQQKKAFFQVWTRKEAHMKVTGEGLRLSPSKFTVSVPPADAEFLNYLDRPHSTTWQMQDLVFEKSFSDYCGCLSVEGGFSKLSLFTFHE